MRQAGNRYSLAHAGAGALLLDLTSGEIVELNESATFIWKRSLSGESQNSIAAALGVRYRLEMEIAIDHVGRALRISSDSPRPPPTDFNYERIGAEYLFSFRGHPIFRVDDRGDGISLHPEAQPFRSDLSALLHAVAPKLLALRGHVVLHAAAVEIGGGVVALAGVSGAGKTTTAHALVEGGARLVCEDQLAVSFSGSRTTAALAGEKMIRSWISESVEDLRASGRVLCRDLDQVSIGERRPLTELGFLDKNRRTSGRYSSSVLSAERTAGAVFRHTFYGSDSDVDWSRALKVAARIGDSVVGFDLWPPDGLDRLVEVARALAAAGTLRA